MAKIAVHCAHSKMIPLAEVRENPRNPNIHPEMQIEYLAKIIREQGWRSPITISNLSGFIVRGHGRLAAAKKLGAKTVPVDFQDYANEAAEMSDLIADNRISELAHIDETLLGALVVDLEKLGADIELTGYDKLELDELLKGLGEIGDSKDDDLSTDPVLTEDEFKIMIVCRDEDHQRELLGVFSEEGLECQALIL